MLNNDTIEVVTRDDGVEASKLSDPLNPTSTPSNPACTTTDNTTIQAPRYDSEADSVIVDMSTTAKLQETVEMDLDLLLSGKISQLSAQTELLMERLVSMSGSVSSASSVRQVTAMSPRVTPLPFAQVAATPKTTALAASDVRRLSRLDGSPDVDVAAVLPQYRLVAGFKAKTARPNDEEYADSLAFEHL